MIKEFVIQNIVNVLIYVAVINVLGFLSMGFDKFKAKHEMWRTKEQTLFIIAIIGGSLGSILGMYTFRHKTKHTNFTVGMPTILLVQIVMIIYIFLNWLVAKKNTPFCLHWECK